VGQRHILHRFIPTPVGDWLCFHRPVNESHEIIINIIVLPERSIRVRARWC
jgi:hypothetical protein